MPFDYSEIFGSLDGSKPIYPPFERITPYPKHFVVNMYSSYILTTGKLICITHPDQVPAAKRLQTALADLGFHWEIRLHQPDEGRKNVGVQFAIKPLERGVGAYEIEIESRAIHDAPIMSLVANDLAGLERGVNTLIQVIQLAFKEFGEYLASLWIKDWLDDSQTKPLTASS